ncbi:hypothetical protein EMCRGX_G012722 [Ephydatia muelleri]
MDRILRGSQESEAYLDDVVIISETWEEHLKHLTDILERIRKAGLTVKLGKCQFAMSQCVYLGHVVGNGNYGMRMHVEAGEKLPIDKVIKTAFCDVLGDEVEHISVLMQIEEQWGERKVFADLQGRCIPDRSILQVIPVRKVSELKNK